MSEHTPFFSMLADLSKENSSDGRREILRKVTDAIHQKAQASGDTELTGIDDLLSRIAADYSVQARSEIAKLIATNPRFNRTAEKLALDDIEVAGPILIRSRVVSDATLLKVIAKNSQPHMMAVTERWQISPAISYALVKAGNDEVVVALLSNASAELGYDSFEAVATRAQDNVALQGPLVRRKDVPIELLNELYLQVELGLRREIIRKFDSISLEEIDMAFQRSRHRVSRRKNDLPIDFDLAQKKIDDLVCNGGLTPPVLAKLLRDGKASRTAFVIAFAQLASVDFELAHRAVFACDLDAIALLCRGASFDRALYVTLAIALRNPDDRSGPSAEALGGLYEAVPVQAAQRAIRFWKVRAAA